VVDTTGDPVIAVGIAPTAVAGKVLALVGREVGLLEAGVVAIDRAHHPGPGPGDAEIAGGLAFEHLAVGVDDLRRHAEERPRRRARLQLGRAGQRRDQDAAGFGLPPGIDDRAAVLANHAIVPFPGFRIDRLADRAEQAQALARGFFHWLVAALHQCADRG